MTCDKSGQVEHALGDEFAIANFGKRQKTACHRDIDCAATIGRIPSAQQNGLAPVKPCRISPCDGQCRDVVQRGLNGQKRVGEVSLAGRARIASEVGRASLVLTTWPSVSSVSRSSPQATVNR